MRRSTLHAIQTRRLSKENTINLKKYPYWQMDSQALQSAGIGTCRRKLAKMLQTKVLSIMQLLIICLYALTVLAYFVFHDVTYDDRVSEFSTLSTGISTEGTDGTFRAINLAESALIVIFVVEFTLHSIGFGLLFVGRFWAIANLILLAVNILILVLFS